MANAWVITAARNEADTTPDYVVHSDGFTLIPVATDIDNPAWVDDGVQTSPDINGETRYLTLFDNPEWDDDGSQTTPDAEGNDRYLTVGADLVNLAKVYPMGAYSIQNLRAAQADFQGLHLDKAVNISEATVSVTLA